VRRQARAAEVVRQPFVALRLVERLADVAARQQHEAVHAERAGPHALADVQAEVRIAREPAAGVQQRDVVGGTEPFRQRIERLGREPRRDGQRGRAHAARGGRFEERLHVGRGDARG